MNGKGNSSSGCSEMKSPSNAVLPTLRATPAMSTSGTATLSRTQHIFRTPLSTLSETNNSPSTSPASTATPTQVVLEDCRVPECSSGGVVYSINGDDSNSFNSNCKQCLAERAAAALEAPRYGGTLQHHIKDGSEEIEERRPLSSSPDPPGRTYECETWCRGISRLVAGFFGVFILALSYAALGGFVFMVIELRASRTHEGLMLASESKSPPNISHLIPKEVQESLDRARLQTVNKLWKVTEEMNILYPKNWTRKAAEEIIWFQDILTNELTRTMRSIAEAEKANNEGSHPEDPVLRPMRAREWTFARGMLYSVSLLTTVGSGMDWAMSPLSRAISVVYIIIGIPIMFLYLSTSGELFCKALTFISSRTHFILCRRSEFSSPGGRHNPGSGGSILFRSQPSGSVILSSTSSSSNNRCKRSSSQTPFYSASSTERISLTPLRGSEDGGSVHRINVQQSSVPVILPILGVLLLLLTYILLGSLIVSRSQGWTLKEGFYFSFLSMSTVGFGSLRPSDDSARDLWPCVIYIFIGATVSSTAFYILRDHVLKKTRKTCLIPGGSGSKTRSPSR